MRKTMATGSSTKSIKILYS